MKREWKPKDLKKAFFNVDLTDLQVNLGFEWKKVKDYRAVVNLDEKNVICVVSRNYHLVTNEEAYNIGDYVKKQWEELKRKLICLRRIEMTSSMALPMFSIMPHIPNMRRMHPYLYTTIRKPSEYGLTN